MIAGRRAYWTAFTLWHALRGALYLRASPAVAGRLQDRRVRAMVAHAYASVPFYRSAMDAAGLRPADFHTAADLARLPLISGADLAATPERFRADGFRPDELLVIQSTGTTGRPKAVAYDAPALFLSLAHGLLLRYRMARALGRTYGYREMQAYGLDGTSHEMRDYYEAHSWTPARYDYDRTCLDLNAPLADNIAQLNAFRPHLLVGFGSYLGSLYRYAWQRGMEIWRPRLIAYGADCMWPADRRLIEERFGVPVFTTYQASEALRIAFECRHGRLHLYTDQVAVRVVDAQGRPVGPGGRGRLIVSNLANRATVLLNYEIGDWVRLAEGPCPCGCRLPAIAELQGRSDDMLVLPNGGLLPGIELIWDFWVAQGIAAMQIEQEDLSHYRVRVVWDANAPVLWEEGAPMEDGERVIAAAVRRVFGSDVAVAVEAVEAIPRGPGGKQQASISRCGRMWQGGGAA